ncbi:DUF1517 domain-containing protein [Stenomitos frigidus]|uniref:DUF1517 domain-containing protein n=1 Tax=Stenomitos frigidus ULC18 TaxID=2107698 RepID=A0A2T1ET16_9CYAN|nr:DUF1517 domain-containing protein [Stenomitos frigidus]PSB35851.1 hypothetical protein C7B82_00100 [Stenomitos frigidus ULC18]
MGHSKLRRYCAIATSTLLAGTLTIHLPTESTQLRLTIASEASARSSGGRSGGGSFRSSPSRSSPSKSSPSRSSGSSGFNNSPSYQRDRYYNGGGGPVIVPVPVGPGVYNDPYRNNGNNNGNNNGQASTNNSGIGWIVALFFIGVSAIVVFGLVFFVFKAMRNNGGASGTQELDNDIVTVSKIQVALLAEAREIQSELTELSLEVDTDTSEGLLQLVQEAALALLRMPENWSHVLADSQTVKSREDAQALFNKLSIVERSKFSVETLTNVGGRVNKRDGFKPDPEEGPASYIVVTLLVGTAHDKQLFSQIRTQEDLSQALERLASLPSDYLMAFELLWSPQESSDSLTYDELLTEYTEMVQL